MRLTGAVLEGWRAPGRARVGAESRRARARALAMRVRTTFVRRALVLSRALDGPLPKPRPLLRVSISRLDAGDVSAYLVFRRDQPRHEIERRLARGDRCFACWHGDRIVDAGWLSTARVHVPYLRRDIVLDRGEAYNYDFHTAPGCRGLGLFVARTAHVAHVLQGEGCSRSLGIVAVENRASWLLLLRSGVRPIGLYGCVRVGPWQRDWRESWTEEPLPAVAPVGGRGGV